MTKLKTLRTQTDLKQSDVANACDLSLRSYQNLEQGRDSIDRCKLETLLRLCFCLNCKLSDILEDENLVSLYEKTHRP